MPTRRCARREYGGIRLEPRIYQLMLSREGEQQHLDSDSWQASRRQTNVGFKSHSAEKNCRILRAMMFTLRKHRRERRAKLVRGRGKQHKAGGGQFSFARYTPPSVRSYFPSRLTGTTCAPSFTLSAPSALRFLIS